MIWYAVLTQARKEGLANDLLRQQGIETLYLHYRTTVKHARRKEVVLRPYFPRYLFAAPSGVPMADINRTIGVSTVVYLGDKPLEIPSPVIEELRERGNPEGRVQMSLQEKSARRRFRRGEQVRINDGPMAGLLAVISVDSGHQVQVRLEMFKRKVKVDLKPEAVSPIRRRLPQ